MKAVILAGGYGTRISEESGVRPKPMVEIGGKPVLWHIMKIYSCYGINDFIICCGYKGYVIKEYFANYFLNNSDVTFSMSDNSMEVHRTETEPWNVTLVNTGYNTMTGGRLKRVKDYIGDEAFCMTYGDGLSNVNIAELIDFHRSNGKLATLTAVQQPGRFGAFTLSSEETTINHFQEKPNGSEMPWINGGFFVLEPEVIDYIDDDSSIWEQQPLEMLARSGQLSAFRHTGFWQPMDTLRDKNVLQELWQNGKAPWHEQAILKQKLPVDVAHLNRLTI
ncbi:glucose-1-phosphate cytidylyltransferase [Arcticibacter tournemirensis]|uniref:Glucose-1-phosphate cytidylyltransferase n=1 Tax=Arcticibacter tournemirensis TaxID=699437 RepID=A0A5M9HN25_9SPHI|nr:glucose-1-phosphate cytidylyltransferase [Arcticibacter tournemirensis]KAA8486794.1 glucose-1-phosphate cytidylyltransferase [Arcticibacter tournemirensis]TQM49338.1 glucose-1-phosphate cytidylyltransferase [Arcticibacter tournemirensis]